MFGLCTNQKSLLVPSCVFLKERSSELFLDRVCHFGPSHFCSYVTIAVKIKMCMLHFGLKEELDSFYPEEDRSSSNQVRMMDKALSMLIYDEYVPMPMCRAPEYCQRSVFDQIKISSGMETALSEFSFKAQSQMFGSDSEPNSSFRMTDILSAIAHTAMEEHHVDERDLSGWDVSMSPILEPLKQSPPRPNLFLSAPERQTLFLGKERSTEAIKYVRGGVQESKYPSAGLFIRSTDPASEPNKALSSWSNLGDEAMDLKDESEWVIA